MTPEQQANEARILLENPLFNGAFEDVKTKTIALLENTTPVDVEYRQELIVTLQVIKAIKRNIEDYVNTAMLEGE